MRPLSRNRVGKSSSSAQFRSNTRRTKAPNIGPPPMRGGFRL